MTKQTPAEQELAKLIVENLNLENVAPESIDPDQPIRVLSYGRKAHVYRVFFTVDDAAKVVRVVHVRRGARRPPLPAELKDVDEVRFAAVNVPE